MQSTLKSLTDGFIESISGNRKHLSLAVSGIIILAAYQLIFVQFFPNQNGLMGHDFSLFLPRLMDGYLWIRNNSLTDIPWFTPSFCGGLPAYPDPQNIFYSLPQLLTLFFSPVTSVYVTLLLMSVSGYCGSYLLLKSVFRTSTSAAVLGSTIFLFNGFFAYRMIIGHIIFHSYMLFPWIIYFVFRPVSPARLLYGMKPWIINGLLAGSIASYLVFSGAVNILLPMSLSGLIIVLGLMYRNSLNSLHLKAIVLALTVFLVVVAAKLNASISYLGHFDRSFYPLPGTDSIASAFYVVVRTLFFPVTDSSLQNYFTNKIWMLGRHEFEYGVTLVPLILFVSYLAKMKSFAAIKVRVSDLPIRKIGTAVSIALLLLIPITLNYYQPDWNLLLKKMPVLRNSSTLIRFNVVYILPLAVFSAVLLDRITAGKKTRFMMSAILVGAIILINLVTDKTFYQSEKYDPLTISLMYKKIANTGHVPKITFVGDIENTNTYQHPSQVGADFLFGISRLTCYEPMFGYRLEAFPRKSLHPGPVNAVTNGHLNLKNPVCYVFPKANSCIPGEQFSIASSEQADKFASYKKYDFALPGMQIVMDYLSLSGILVCMMAILLAGLGRVYLLLKRGFTEK